MKEPNFSFQTLDVPIPIKDKLVMLSIRICDYVTDDNADLIPYLKPLNIRFYSGIRFDRNVLRVEMAVI